MKTLIEDPLKVDNLCISMPLIAISIEIVHWEPPRSGHLSLNNGLPAVPQRTVNIPQEWTDTKTVSINHENKL